MFGLRHRRASPVRRFEAPRRRRSRPVGPAKILPFPRSRIIRRSILALEDRRRWHPAGGLAALGALHRADRRIIIPPELTMAQKAARRPVAAFLPKESLSHRVRFAYPLHVATCVRRHVRREVMHAMGFAGAGGSPRKPPRRNFWSQVEC